MREAADRRVARDAGLRRRRCGRRRRLAATTPVVLRFFDLERRIADRARSAGRRSRDADERRCVLIVVAPTACQRHLRRSCPTTAGSWHLPSDLRAHRARASATAPLPEPARDTLRLAKSIELLCAHLRAASATTRWCPLDGAGALSRAAMRARIAARAPADRRALAREADARRDRARLRAQPRQADPRLPPTLRLHRRRCDRRARLARRAADAAARPTCRSSSIGYRCGYLNNASFTRAFSRRFGVAPTQLRARGLAA